MKWLIVLSVLLLSGCVAVPNAYYTQPSPIYVQPAPIYVQPRPVYVVPPRYVPRCYWTQQWNGYYRRYQNVQVCR
jgi:hypothetical protein